MNPGGTPQNLRPWKKGESGNARGRRKDPSVWAEFKKLLKKRDLDQTNAKAAAQALLDACLSGNVPALLAVVERQEGKIPQTLDVNVLLNELDSIIATYGAGAEGGDPDPAQDDIPEAAQD